MLCPYCKEEIQDGAVKCKHCGSMISEARNILAASTATTVSADAYTEYSQVPWYRQNWFFILSCLIFAPVGVSLILSGDVYYMKNKQLKTYGKGYKIGASIYGLLWLLWIFSKMY
jgi:uncharacterized membrane protein YvbJ